MLVALLDAEGGRAADSRGSEAHGERAEQLEVLTGILARTHLYHTCFYSFNTAGNECV